jgi:hypothetical protein
MVAAQEVINTVNLNGWYAGYAVAAAVIVVVVMLVGWILSLARRIGTQVDDIVAELAAIRTTTEPIPAVGQVNAKLTNIVNTAAAARSALVGES